MLKRQLALLGYFRFFNALRFAAPLLVIYFSAVAGSFALGMSVFAITSVSQLVFDIPLGVLSDRAGRRPVMVAGTVVSLLCTVCYAIGRNYGFLAAGAALEGLARALYSGVDTALLHETLAEHGAVDRYPEYLGVVSASEPVAFAVAALAGGAIATHSFHLAFWLTLLPQTVALGVCLRLHEPAVRETTGHTTLGHLRAALREFGHNPRLRLLVMAAAWKEAFAESAFQFRLAFFQMLWPVWALGIAQAITNLASAASFYLSGRAIARFTALKVLAGDLLLGRLVNTVALLLPSVLSPLLMSSTSITYGVSEVAMGALQQREFTNAQRATMASINSQALNLAFAAASVALGLVADRLGPVKALLIVQALLLGTLLFYRPLFAHAHRPPPDAGS